MVERHDQVVAAFLKLVHLFWNFDQSGIFEILRNLDGDGLTMEGFAQRCLELLQAKLQDEVRDCDPDTDIQRADILVTRQWMRTVMWRTALKFGITLPATDPVNIADEYLHLVSRLPTAALESHGPTMVNINSTN